MVCLSLQSNAKERWRTLDMFARANCLASIHLRPGVVCLVMQSFREFRRHLCRHTLSRKHVIARRKSLDGWCIAFLPPLVRLARCLARDVLGLAWMVYHGVCFAPIVSRMASNPLANPSHVHGAGAHCTSQHFVDVPPWTQRRRQEGSEA